jgi:hypothetical protein
MITLTLILSILIGILIGYLLMGVIFSLAHRISFGWYVPKMIFAWPFYLNILI